MNCQINNILYFLNECGVVIDNPPMSAAVLKLLDDTEFNEKLENMEENRKYDETLFLSIAKYIIDETQIKGFSDVKQNHAQLGKMVNTAMRDAAAQRHNPEAEDFGYLYSNTTFGQNCGHRSDRPIYCTVCGKDTKLWDAPSVYEMLYSEEY